jgi:methylmalonyl-CoA epimerase
MIDQHVRSNANGSCLAAIGDLVLGIDHVAVAVEELDTAIAWYSGCLGFRCVERRTTRGEHSGMEAAVMAAGNALIVLIQGTSPDSQVNRFIEHFGVGVQHLAFAVSDLDEAVRRVVRAGGSVDTDKIEDTGIRQVFLRRDAGSGVRVELIQKLPGKTFTDRSVEQLFRSFEQRDLY